MKRSKPSTTHDPNDTGFLLVEWECPKSRLRGVGAVEAERFDSWQKAEDAAFNKYHDDGVVVKDMWWVWGRLP